MNQNSFYDYRRILEYMMGMRPFLEKSALFSDGTNDYRIPSEPEPGDEIRIRFRTAKNNVDGVWLCYGDKQIKMEVVEQDEQFDFFETKIKVGTKRIVYYFRIVTGRLVCEYDRSGAVDEGCAKHFFYIYPGFHVPEWSKGAVMYQIFVDRFYNGDKTNDIVEDEYQYLCFHAGKSPNWNKCPDPYNVAQFYGGDLEGVRQKLDYLQDLGVDVIYLNPIFVSPSNHKYDIQDYDYVDPHFGKIVVDEGEVLERYDEDNIFATKYISRVTDKRNLEASNELFAQLTKEIHERGMKIILDGVFNHCGSFNKWMDRERIYENKEEYKTGAYIAKDSPYHDYFKFEPEGNWPYNGVYNGWWGHETLPKLQYEQSPELEEYILGIAKKWLSEPYNIDGWRLDVAADLGMSQEYNHKFWKKFRKVVKETNPDALILAEHYGNPAAWLKGDEWDTVMNYDAFMDPVSWFMTGVDKHSESYQPEAEGNLQQFLDTMHYFMADFPIQSLQCSMNELSNHDHSRFLTRTNHKTGRVQYLGAKAAEEDVNKGVFRAAVMLQMTWPGAPTIYYGDEAGVCGFTDPDNRRTYPWGNEDKELIRYHKELIALHKSSPVFKNGSLKIVKDDENILAYGRFTRAEQYVVIINIANKPEEITISAWELGLPQEGCLKQLIFSNEDGYSTAPVEYKMQNGRFDIQMQRYSAVVLKGMGEE
ncbi:glycoside hydrolase family 13 protein [Eubacterium oxidoreducens]|uniref:Alpha-glucosidase n=1 Tax=Eubacterium oxidoreducens TaxID=1732 RepID=A0A1G6BWN4_EUBOX|nr:glycoside hydrolase family 13 protein [Eubacterium oxidoreducens]SDB25073.1 alpha-glucosidase [Eubacterium oxidoreducens]